MVDPIATRDQDSVYVHLIHRHFDQPQTVRLDLTAYPALDATATVYSMVGSPIDEVGNSNGQASGAQFEIAYVVASTADQQDGVVEVTLPPASLTTVAIAVSRATSTGLDLEGGALRVRVAPNPARRPHHGPVRPRGRDDGLDASVRHLGRQVIALEGAYGAGTQTLDLEVADLPAGVYVVRLEAGGDAVSRHLHHRPIAQCATSSPCSCSRPASPSPHSPS